MSDEDLFPGQRSDQDLFSEKTQDEKTADFRNHMASITVEILAFFLSEKVGNVDLKCPLCGHDRLTVPRINMYSLRTGQPVAQVHAHYARFLEGDNAEYDPSCHEFSIICKHCGNTLKINAGVVMDWYNARERAI